MDNMADAMDWRVDTPPKVYYTSNSQPPKRVRDESPQEEQQLEQERGTPSRFAAARSAPAGSASIDTQLPPIGNGFTREDFLNFGQHELLMDDHYRRLNSRDLVAGIPAANSPPAFRPMYYLLDQSTLGLPLPPQPNLNQQAQEQWWQCCANAIATVTVLVTTVTMKYARLLGDCTLRVGRYTYQNRGRATQTITAFTEGATATKRRIIEFVRPRPQSPRRRSPPRVINRPHPHMTSTRIRLENKERAKREALEAAAMDITDSTTGDFEPLMSGALPCPEDFQPSISGGIQSPSGFRPILSNVASASADFHFPMPGGMLEDVIPTTSNTPSVPTGANSGQSTTTSQGIHPYEGSPDSDMNGTILATTPTKVTRDDLSEPWETSTLDIPYNSDSDMDEPMSEDDDHETPTMDEMDLEVGLPVNSAQWATIAELQRLSAEEDESGMDLTLECDEPSSLENSQVPQPAYSGLSNLICSPPNQALFNHPGQTPQSALSGLSNSIWSQTPQSAFSGLRNSILSPPNQASFMNSDQPQSSPLSDVPSDFDTTPPATTPARRSPKKSVGFYESPKTGRPVNRVKKYYIGESMAHPVSSSPPKGSEGSSISSTVDSDTSVYDDDPILEAAAAAHGRSLAQANPTSAVIMSRSSLILAMNDDTPAGKPDPAGNIHKTTCVPVSIGHTAVEIAGSVGCMPTDASLILHGSPDIGLTESEIVGAVGSMPAAASPPFNGPILAPIHNNQCVTRKTRRRAGAPSFTVTAQGSPIKRKSRSPPRSAKSLSRLSMESMLMQENASPRLKSAIRPATTSATTPAGLMSHITEDEHVLPAESSVGSFRKDASAGREETSQKQDTAIECVATPGSQSSTSNQSTPQQDLTDQLGSMRVSDRRLSSRTKKKELEEAKLREEEKQRVTDEKARKEREEAEAAAEKARLEKEKAEEAARAAKKAEEERKRNSAREIPVEKVIQPLAADWEAKVDAAMAKQRNIVIAKSSIGTALTRKDFGTLFPQAGKDPAHGWLNDEIIMAYLQAVVDHGREISGYKDGDVPKYHAFNTFFFKNIRDKGVQSVKRWATRAKIGGKNLESVERVFIPVHSGAHWTLLVISPMAHTIEYFDSMGGAAAPYTKAAKDWLKQEMGKSYKEEEWKIVLPEGGGPQQSNSSDCGVFTVTTAKMVLLGIDPTAYSSRDIPLQRKRMVAELMNGGFTADFAPNFTFGTSE